jgi:hypothetical protein
MEFRDLRAGSNGGAIHVGASSTLRADNVIFFNNTAMRGGGLGTADASSASVTVWNAVFRNNTASDAGGGASLVGLASSSSTNLITFIGNRAKVGGGLHYTSGQLDTMNQFTFTSNIADNEGGGLYINSTVLPANIVTPKFTSNQATSGGGATIISSGGSVNLISPTWLGNRATSRACELETQGANVFMVNGVSTGCVTSNSCFNIVGAPATVSATLNNIVMTNASVTNGNAAFSIASMTSVTITGPTFNFNSVPNGSALRVVSSPLTMNGGQFNGNVGLNGAALYIEGTASLTAPQFQNNVATGGFGGALFVKHPSSATTFSMTGGTFISNTVSDSETSARPARGGGAVRVEGDGTTTFQGVFFSQNTATYAPASTANLMVGGAIFASKTTSGAGALVLSSCTVSQNGVSATNARGGAVYADVNRVAMQFGSCNDHVLPSDTFKQQQQYGACLYAITVRSTPFFSPLFFHNFFFHFCVFCSSFTMHIWTLTYFCFVLFCFVRHL